MAIEKVLKRKDAASVIVAVAVGMLLYQFVSHIGVALADRFSTFEVDGVGSPDWQDHYLVPFIALLVQLLLLEAVIWLYSAINAAVSKGRR